MPKSVHVPPHSTPTAATATPAIHDLNDTNTSCCAKLHCISGEALAEPGVIQGRVCNLKGDELETLSTYFHNALHLRKKIDGEKTAIDFYDRAITFNELSTFSSAIADQLKETVAVDSKTVDVGSDVIFAVCLPVSEKLITIIFAILKTGAAYLPLDPQYPEVILQNIINKFKPKVFITDLNGPIQCKLDPKSIPEDCKLIGLEELWLNMELKISKHAGVGAAGRGRLSLSVPKHLPAPYPFIVQRAPTTRERVAIVLQTRGLISDKPKGVRISHMNIMNLLVWTWKELPFDRKGNCCLSSPVLCVESIAQIFGPLLKGVALHLFSKRDTKLMRSYIQAIGEKKITRISLRPVVLQDFINEAASFDKPGLQKTLKHLKYVICLGQLVTRNAVSQFLQVFPRGKYLYSLYGHPEISGDIIGERFKSFAGFNDVDLHKSLLGKLIVGGIGKTVYNNRIYILDPKLNPVKEGDQGQICVTGMNVALGYVDEDDDGAFVQNPFNEGSHANYKRMFRTGDYGRMVHCDDRQVRLLIEGRLDELVHHQGFDFFLDDVRKTILSIPEVQDTHIQLLHPGRYDQTVVAFVVLNQQEEPISIGELDFQLRSKLPEYMVPELRLLEHIPVVETGRVDASLLLQKYEAGRRTTFVDWDKLPLIRPAKAKAAQVLLEALYKFCSISVETSAGCMHKTAFELGCDSLSSVSTLLSINANGYHITLNDFLEHASLTEMIDIMVERCKDEERRQEITLEKYHAYKAYEDMTLDSLYIAQALEERHKTDVIQLLAACCVEKGGLEQFTLVSYTDYTNFLKSVWDRIVKRKLCIVVLGKRDFKVAGVALVIDFFEDLNLAEFDGSLRDMFGFENEIKSQFLPEMSHEVNNTMQLFSLGTKLGLPSKENVKIVALLLSHLKKTAEVRNYANIYLATSNQLLEDMCHYMMRFQILDEYCAREFEVHGRKPFRLAPNTVVITALLLNVHEIEEEESVLNIKEKADKEESEHDGEVPEFVDDKPRTSIRPSVQPRMQPAASIVSVQSIQSIARILR